MTGPAQTVPTVNQLMQSVKKLMELTLSYRRSQRWPELDVLYQLGQVLIEDSYIISNIDTRYPPGSGQSYLSSVKRHLAAIGISNVAEFYEVLSYFFSTSCGDDFEKLIEARIQSLDQKFKQVVSELSLYEEGTLLAPEWTLKACSWSIGTPEAATEKKLVETGLVNRFYYKARHFSHPAWDIPDHARQVLRRIKLSPEELGAIKLDKAQIPYLAKAPGVLAFVHILKANARKVGLEWWIDEYKFQRLLVGSKGAIGDLVGSGAMTVRYSPDRKSGGKLSSRPAECIFSISPEFLDALGCIGPCPPPNPTPITPQ